VSNQFKMRENSPFVLAWTHYPAARTWRSALLASLAVMVLVSAAVPSAFSQDRKRIYLPADATGVTLLRVDSSTTESAKSADRRTELKLEEYGRTSQRISYKRIPSIAVVIQYRAPSQAMTRPVIRGGIEENVASSIRQRTVHFTTDLTSRSFKLVPKGRITSMVARDDTALCWQRSPSWTDFQYSYGCRSHSIRSKFETLAFDVVQH
jgi:hypothetical protein